MSGSQLTSRTSGREPGPSRSPSYGRRPWAMASWPSQRRPPSSCSPLRGDSSVTRAPLRAPAARELAADEPSVPGSPALARSTRAVGECFLDRLIRSGASCTIGTMGSGVTAEERAKGLSAIERHGMIQASAAGRAHRRLGPDRGRNEAAPRDHRPGRRGRPHRRRGATAGGGEIHRAPVRGRRAPPGARRRAAPRAGGEPPPRQRAR